MNILLTLWSNRKIKKERILPKTMVVGFKAA